jgi:tetratricopeptide (TPR) repeat protein
MASNIRATNIVLYPFQHSSCMNTASIHSIPYNATYNNKSCFLKYTEPLFQRQYTMGFIYNRSMSSNKSIQFDKAILKELEGLKKEMGNSYANGNYQSALELAMSMHNKVKDYLDSSESGYNHGIYASTLNNLALMNKLLGNNEAAMNQYIEALMIYKEVYKTHEHVSYAAALTNLGILYKTMAEESSGIDKDQLLARSEEALNDAFRTRETLLGDE